MHRGEEVERDRFVCASDRFPGPAPAIRSRLRCETCPFIDLLNRGDKPRADVPVRRAGSRTTAGGLGDVVSSLLARIGVTEDRVSAWLGRPCGCGERRKRLNALGRWGRRALTLTLAGRSAQAVAELETLLSVDCP